MHGAKGKEKESGTNRKEKESGMNRKEKESDINRKEEEKRKESESDNDDDNADTVDGCTHFYHGIHSIPLVKNEVLCIFLDINGLLVFRKWIDGEYTETIVRPYAQAFLEMLINDPQIEIVFWTGVTSEKQQRLLMVEMKKLFNISEWKPGCKRKKRSFRVLRAIDEFKKKGPNSTFPGSNKPIYLKPLSFVKNIFLQYFKYVLIDDENDMLKSKGKNKKGDLSNPDKEHLSIKTFDGDLNDRELKEGEQGWELVFDYIHNIFNM